MWLIHTRSLELKYFVGDNIPPYAILYHTWGDEEVTFQDWQDLEKASQKKGFAKIQSACAQALGDRLSYIWVDTNCIDKSSSAELSEAINSMFAWYSDSQICYVYLADVEDVPGNFGRGLAEMGKRGWDDVFEGRMSSISFKGAEAFSDDQTSELQKFLSSFCGSRWFTRGWTLQELLAPRAIRFLAQNWKPIEWQGYACDTVMNPWERSHKSRQRLILRLLAHRTGIELKAILYSESVMSSSIVERMSWMKGRETTREEDLSYCLLGIFDINMPLLYGEGSKAFMRLQEEIIKQSTDQSLFAWQWPQTSRHVGGRHPNIFASSIRLFSNFGINPERFVPSVEGVLDDEKDTNPPRTIVSLTNFGLSISLELIPTGNPEYLFGAINTLPVFRKDCRYKKLWCLPLQKRGRAYYRAPFPPTIIPIRTNRPRAASQIYLPRDHKVDLPERFTYKYAFLILFPSMTVRYIRVTSEQERGAPGVAILSADQSTVFMPPDMLNSKTTVASVLNIHNQITPVVLYIGARETDDGVEIAVKLFPAGTPLATVEKTRMTFRPPAYYRDEWQHISMTIDEGYRIDPLPGEFSIPITIFSVSIYVMPDVQDRYMLQAVPKFHEEMS